MSRGLSVTDSRIEFSLVNLLVSFHYCRETSRSSSPETGNKTKLIKKNTVGGSLKKKNIAQISEAVKHFSEMFF